MYKFWQKKGLKLCIYGSPKHSHEREGHPLAATNKISAEYSRERLARSWASPHVEKFYTVAWEPFCPKIADLVFFFGGGGEMKYILFKYVLHKV